MKDLFHTLDQPIYKDWVFYLWIVSIITIVPTTLGSGAWIVSLLDFTFGLIVQYFVFLRIPAWVRTRIRERNA